MNSSTLEREDSLNGGLVILEGPRNGGRWSFSESLTRIGRSDSCDLCFAGAGIRLVHCVVIVTPTGPMLRSVRGLTYINGIATEQRMLLDGDVIAIGPYRLEVHWPLLPSPDPAAPLVQVPARAA